VLVEIVLSSLIAPVMMLMQSVAVLGIATGRDAGWKAQRRDDGSIPFRELVRRHRTHTLCGVVLAGVAYSVSPVILAWMSPVVLGLVLAIPVSALTGWPALGMAVHRLGLLATPEETAPPAVLQRANELACDWATTRPQLIDVFARLASDAQRRTSGARESTMLICSWGWPSSTTPTVSKRLPCCSLTERSSPSLEIGLASSGSVSL
jgi:membrane glycosyltransferase